MLRKMRRLAIVTTHPIQYNAPLFRLLEERKKISIHVFYTWSQSETGDLYDPGFGVTKKWDLPLLEGYSLSFSRNTARNPGSHNFLGIQNPNILKEIRAYKPDAVLVYGWNFLSHWNVINKFGRNLPVFFRGDSTLLDSQQESILKRILKRIILNYIYGRVSKAFFAGTHNKDYFLKYGKKEDELVFMPHAIDNKRFAESSAEECTIFRSKLQIPVDALVCLFAGKLEKKKNPWLLAESFTAAKQKNAHLVFVGSGEEEQALKEAFRPYPNIHFLSFQNQSLMPTIYTMANIFVLPSQGPQETWGLAVNEAMAAGLPVIVSDKCGCNADLVIEGLNGFVFQSGNKEQLTILLSQILSWPQPKLKEMGLQSKQIISSWNFLNAAIAIESVLLNDI